MEEKRGYVVEGMEGTGDASEEAGTGKGSASLPPADFSGFVVGLAQTALIQLGEIPDPSAGKAVRNLDQARYTIDLIDLLEKKTRGNLTEEEGLLIRRLLGDLKMRYVRAS